MVKYEYEQTDKPIRPDGRVVTGPDKEKRIFGEMDRLIPWGKWVEEIRPCYYKGERGSNPKLPKTKIMRKSAQLDATPTLA